MAKPVKIKCAATGRVLLVRPIDAAEWVASGAGTRVTASDGDLAEPAVKRGRAKRGGRAAKNDEMTTSEAPESAES